MRSELGQTGGDEVEVAQVVRQEGGEGKQIYKIYTILEFENLKGHQEVMMISGIYNTSNYS